MLQSVPSVFIVYRRKTLTGSLDPMHANGTNKPCIKLAKLVLTPLNEFEIDVWCNKMVEYYNFVPPPDGPNSSNATGYSLHIRKPKPIAVASGISLRNKNNVNYAPMMDSDADDRDEDKKPTPNKIRPKLDLNLNSAAVLRAHAHMQRNRQKNFETKPIPVLPTQNCSRV